MKKLHILLLAVLLSATAGAQKINHDFHQVSLSDALRYIIAHQQQYNISFIYNELEDFRVTADVRNQNVPEAINQLIGFYPVSAKVKRNVTDAEGRPMPDEIYVECIQKERRKVIGRVVDGDGQPMGFVNISLLHAADSTFVNGGVSTEAGDFVIPCAEKDLLIKLSYVGYKTIIRRIEGLRVGTVTMRPDAYNLKGVTVRGHHKMDYVDHSTYTFTDEQVRNARQSQDLIATLPGLRVDAMTGKLASLFDKSLKILINGVEATDNDLKSIEPDKIKNVEYYTIPPARYAGAGTLINIHTRRLDNGYALGFDTKQAVSRGFNNTNVYAKYTKGNSQLAFDYNLNYRNAANCREENAYKMTDNAKTATYTYNGDYHFGYANQNFNLRYLYSIDDSIVFQTRFTPNIFTWFWRDRFDIKASGNDLWQNGHSLQSRTIRSFGPSLDLYFSRKLKDGQQFVADVVGTYFHNKQGNDNHQFDENDAEVLYDDMRQRNNKYSIIGELAYTKAWGKKQFSAGYKATLAKSDFEISNVLSDYAAYDYHATNDNHYAYAQLGGSLAKLSYRLSLGATYIHTANDDTRYNKLYFTPQLLLSYPVKNGRFGLRFYSEPVLPGISQLSNNSTIEIPGLYKRGNPMLRSGNDKALQLQYSLNNPYVNLQTTLVYNHISDPINQYFRWENINGQRVIVRSPLNGDYQTTVGGTYFIQIKPFKSELLAVEFQGGFWRQTEKNAYMGKHRHNYTPFTIYMSSRWKEFGGSFFWRRADMYLDGSYLQSDENSCAMNFFYQHKQLRLSVVCVFPFTTPTYKSETLDNNILSYHHENRIPSQRTMFTLGVSYNLFSGKQKNIRKQIDNHDGDKGTF